MISSRHKLWLEVVSVQAAGSAHESGCDVVAMRALTTPRKAAEQPSPEHQFPTAARTLQPYDGDG